MKTDEQIKKQIETEERNRRIYFLRVKAGQTLKEIGKIYGIGPERVRQIVLKQARILRGWKPGSDYRKYRVGPEEADPAGRNYIIRNGAEEIFLTKIENVKGIDVYTYGSKDWKDAKRFTLTEARELARKRKAVAVWLGVGA